MRNVPAAIAGMKPASQVPTRAATAPQPLCFFRVAQLSGPLVDFHCIVDAEGRIPIDPQIRIQLQHRAKLGVIDEMRAGALIAEVFTANTERCVLARAAARARLPASDATERFKLVAVGLPLIFRRFPFLTHCCLPSGRYRGSESPLVRPALPP